MTTDGRFSVEWCSIDQCWVYLYENNVMYYAEQKDENNISEYETFIAKAKLMMKNYEHSCR